MTDLFDILQDLRTTQPAVLHSSYLTRHAANVTEIQAVSLTCANREWNRMLKHRGIRSEKDIELNMKRKLRWKIETEVDID